jgi:mycothiol synthase
VATRIRAVPARDLGDDRERLDLVRYEAEAADGSVAGWGQIGHLTWHFHPRKYELLVEVEPGYRRQGVGGALFDRLVADLRGRGALLARAPAIEGDLDSIGFLAHRGFREVWRNLRSQLDVTTFDPAGFAGADKRVEGQGISIRTLPEELARDPDVLRKVYAMNLAATHDDQEIDVVTTPPFEEYVADAVRGPLAIPEAWFLARAADRVVGVSTLERIPGSPDVLEVGYTAVHPEYRRRGIAIALSLRTIDYAAEHGIRSIHIDSNAINERMLSISAALGFEPMPARITYELRLA